MLVGAEILPDAKSINETKCLHECILSYDAWQHGNEKVSFDIWQSVVTLFEGLSCAANVADIVKTGNNIFSVWKFIDCKYDDNLYIRNIVKLSGETMLSWHPSYSAEKTSCHGKQLDKCWIPYQHILWRNSTFWQPCSITVPVDVRWLLCTCSDSLS